MTINISLSNYFKYDFDKMSIPLIIAGLSLSWLSFRYLKNRKCKYLFYVYLINYLI
jgi:hypothetical protein